MTDCGLHVSCSESITSLYEGSVANGTSKIVGLANFSSSLEISATFTKSLAVSFLVHLFRSRNLNFLPKFSKSRICYYSQES